MSDILPSIEPETQGQVTKLDVPLTTFLQQAARPDVADSMWNAVAHTSEDQVNKSLVGNRQLSQDEANEKYKVGDLKFSGPIDEYTAQAMNEREKSRMDQQMYLSSGATKARWLPGMAAGILGATANPLDLGSMFIPFVGEAGKTEQAGRIAMALRRGLIPMEAIERTGIPVPRLVGSMAQATMWQGLAEVPKMYEAHVEGQNMPHITEDMLGQAGFAALMHGAGSVLKMISNSTHEAMSKQSVNDFLEDRDTSAGQYIPLDEHVIAYKAAEELRSMREEAANNIDQEKIKADVLKEYGEFPIDAALRSRSTGEIRTGPGHPFIEGYEHSSEAKGHPDYSPDAEWLRGFVTDKGRFVGRAEANQMTGSGGDYLASEALESGTSDPDWLSHPEREEYDKMIERSMTPAQAITKIRQDREQRRQQRILANPEAQQKMEMMRQAAIDEWVRNKRQELADPVPKKVRQAASERTVPHEEVQKYTGESGHLDKMLDEDIEGLGGKVEKEGEKEASTDAPIDFKSANKEQLGKIKENISKMPPEQLQKNYEHYQNLAKEHIATGKLQDASEASTQGQFYREALENNGGKPKIFEPNATGAIDAALNCLLKKEL